MKALTLHSYSVDECDPFEGSFALTVTFMETFPWVGQSVKKWSTSDKKISKIPENVKYTNMLSRRI